MTKKNQKKIHKYLTLVIIFLVITGVISTAIFTLSVTNLFGSAGESVIYSNELYELKGNPTSYQKDLFKKLTNEIEKSSPDEFEVVSLVVQNFVADFYTWSNKIGTYDVGGKSFIFANEFTNFNSTSRRYLYAPMAIYLANGIEQKDLNEVSEVIINNCNYAYDYDYYGTTYKTYYVEAQWTYNANDKLDTSVLPAWAAFTIIVTEEGRYEIVRFY